MIGLVTWIMKYRVILAIVLLVGAVTVVGTSTGALHAATIEVDPATQENAAGNTGTVELKGDLRGEYVTSSEVGYRSQFVTAQGVLIPGSNAPGASGNLCTYQYRASVNQDLASTPHDGPESSLPMVPDGGTVSLDPTTHAGRWVSPVIGSPINPPLVVSSPTPLESYTFTIDGKVEGKVRVELWGFMGTGLHRIGGSCDTWYRFGYDGAVLKDGSGGIHIAPGQSDRFQEGDTVRFDVHSGFGHWTVSMYDGRGDLACGLNAGGGFNPLSIFFPASIAEFSPGDDRAPASQINPVTGLTIPQGDTGASSSDPRVSALPSGAGPDSTAAATHCKAELEWDGKKDTTITYVIPQGAFVKGGNNVWRISLKNTIMEHAADQLVVLDQKVLAPEAPVVNVTDDSGAKVNCMATSCEAPDVGSTLTYKMTTRLNLESNVPIDHCLVYLWYGESDLTPATDSPAWIARGVSTPATMTTPYSYECSYPYKITKPEEIHSRIYAVDADGRPSGSTLNTQDRQQLDDSGAYKPAPNSTAGQSGQYDHGANGDSRPVVAPKGSDTTAGGATEPPPSNGNSVLFLLGLVLALAAVVIFGLLKMWPVALRAGAFFLVAAGIAAYAWFAGAVPGVS